MTARDGDARVLSRVNTIAAAVVTSVSLLLPPVLYGTIAYTSLTADMEADARVAAESVQQLVRDAGPGQWRLNGAGLDAITAGWFHFDQPDGSERLRIVDRDGRTLSAIGLEPARPQLVRSAAVTEHGDPAGAVEITRSLRPLIVQTTLLAVLGLGLAIASYITFHAVPLRQLRRQNAMLRQRDEQLAVAHTMLRAATEGSLDAILVVDSKAQIVTYTQRFIDLWNVPAELVQSGDDAPVLQAVTAQARDPAAFLARVEYLYAHPDEESRDRVETKDGRILDRYTRGLHGPNNVYLGRIWFFRDITAQERAAVALRDSEARFRAIFDIARDGISLVERQSRTHWLVNDSFCRMLGYASEEVIGLGIDRIHPPDRLEQVLATFERQASGIIDLALDVPMLRKDGTIFYADINSTPVTIGAKTYMVGIFRDVTERKQAEDRLVLANTVLQAEIESAPDAVLVVQNDLTTASYNRNFLDMFGIAAAVAGGHDADAVLAATMPRLNDPDAFWRDVHTLRAAPDQRIRAHEMELKTGRTVEYHGATIRGPGNEAFGRIWFFRDVTERREAEEAVRRSEEKYRNLVESATDFVWETDADGRYTYYSPAARQHLGFDPAELVGKTPYDIMAPDEAARVRAIFETIAAARQPFSMLENTVVAANGSHVVMETSGVPIFDRDGAYRGYRGIERDITRRKTAEAELKGRDALLHAVAVSATALITAPSLDEAIRQALATVSETLRIDRLLVMERAGEPNGPPRLRYSWHRPGLGIVVDQSVFDSLDQSVWTERLGGGEAITLLRSTAPPEFHAFLDRLAIRSMLVVPISVGGRHWGQISFDSCGGERDWRGFETEILMTLAELIGNAIQRDRYVNEIANANRIVQNTPTILYRLKGVPTLPMIYVSENVRLFGYEPAALTQAPLLYQDLIHADDIATVRQKQSLALEAGAASGSYEFRLLTGRGDYRWVENRYTPIRDAGGRLLEIEGLLIDVTERKLAEEKIALLARTDPLTGLANRNTFIERLRQFFAAARRGGPGFALHYVDLDRFKDINDTLGHAVGDHLIVEMAGRLASSVRESDLVGRLGGDEFAILQADVNDNTDAGTLAEKIRSRLAEPMRIDGNLVRGSVSIGIALFGPATATPEDLLVQADTALYRAKDEGRDQYRFHSELFDREVREQIKLADELRVALRDGAFELHYQPQIELTSGRIVGMEALVRWRHPSRGLLPASTFIPVAERAGAVVELGRWVLDHACAQMHRWRQEGVAPEVVAINVSAAEIKSADDYVGAVTAALATWQLNADALELDVTESTLARVTLARSDVLDRLHRMGVRIAIDDFGTKYSSLDYLRAYRVSRLKIPASLTARAARNSGDAAMVRAIIGIARELNIEVIAQGIEDESQWSFMTSMSPTTRVQGYYYSEPVSSQRADELLRRRHIKPSRNADSPTE